MVPSYEQILSFGETRTQLVEYAIEEFNYWVHEGMTKQELMQIATTIGEKYSLLGSELGAQWYDLCSQLAEIEAEPAELRTMTPQQVTESAQAAIDRAETGILEDVFRTYLQDVINNSIRATGDANLMRDYERGLSGGGWCRVPVGETCAFCLILASQGAWYKSKETALGTSPDHYHRGCNCIAVYHADANSIKGYKELEKYKQMYYGADDARIAHSKGKEPYPEELKRRIAEGKARHAALEEKKAMEYAERGEDYEKKPWTHTNEDLIIMRYQYGLK